MALPLQAAAQAPAPADPAAPAAAYQQVATPPGAKLYIISPANKARVRSPFTVQFGLKGMGVTQAGNTSANAGHHHLLVDVKEPISETEIIPSDKNHLHFGGGQTETTLDLPPGRHTLQLVLGDAKHRPLAPLLASQKIEVTVISPTAKKKKHRRPHSHY
ncbi:hypothetical protein CR492_09295 [Methylocella silvestris]|uniref:DUF4399 domain-containing protein n=2 Tax=Methylocella silvestris TaxID=199596 RepID=A0A2J7THW3_METSI|nr:hypothetical protein CR492_09295 [Methylocella silvestris]